MTYRQFSNPIMALGQGRQSYAPNTVLPQFQPMPGIAAPPPPMAQGQGGGGGGSMESLEKLAPLLGGVMDHFGGKGNEGPSSTTGVGGLPGLPAGSPTSSFGAHQQMQQLAPPGMQSMGGNFGHNVGAGATPAAQGGGGFGGGFRNFFSAIPSWFGGGGAGA